MVNESNLIRFDSQGDAMLLSSKHYMLLINLGRNNVCWNSM